MNVTKALAALKERVGYICSDHPDEVEKGALMMATIMRESPFAYTYVSLDGRRDWRMAVSRRRPEAGWTETPLFD